MTNKTLLTFIIPVYNSEEYISSCIESICKSNFIFFEIILINDGSVDKSGFICDKYKNKFNFIKTCHIENSGVANARNTGVEMSSGEYIFFVDNDDLIITDNLNKIKDIITTENPDIILNKYYTIDQKGNIISTGNSILNKLKINKVPSNQVLNYLIKKRINILAPWEYIFKREIIIKNNIKFNTKQSGLDDSSFTPILFCNCNSFFLNDSPIYCWRQRTDSQSRTHHKTDYVRKMISSIETLKKYLDKDKKDYIYFSIFKNIYSLIGPYKKYSDEDKEKIKIWYNENKILVEQSVNYSGVLHRIIYKIFRNKNGLIVSYKLATIKSRVYSMIKKV